MNRREFLRMASAGFAMASFSGLNGAEEPAARKPNVIFFLTDDMGWADPSCYGNTDVKTPNIDQLAAEGMRFTQFYSASPICSPSRTGFTTGMYPARWNISHYLNTRDGNRKAGQADFLDPKAPTLARALKNAGYVTAHIGKWHMGGGRDVNNAPWPKEYGFDESWTTWEGMGPGIDSDPDSKGKFKPYQRTARFVDKAIDFIKRNKGKPFYLNVWPNEVHDPHVPDPEFLPKYDTASKTGEAKFNAVLDKYDREFGRLMQFIRTEGMADNTIVVFSSDNGPNPPFKDHRRTGGLRGMKWSLYEGGIRMPFIVKWPGKIPAGKVDEQTICGAVDLLPTVCRLAGVAVPTSHELDGQDMSKCWLGTPASRRKPLLWEYGRNKVYLRPGNNKDRSPNVAIRDGKWKLLVNADGSDVELYDIISDAKETKNLAGQEKAVTENLSRIALDWRKSLPGMER